MYATPSRPATSGSSRFSHLERLAFGNKPFIAEVARRSHSSGSLQRDALPTPPRTAPPGQRSLSLAGLHTTVESEIQIGVEKKFTTSDFSLLFDGEKKDSNGPSAEETSLAHARWGMVRSCVLKWPSVPEKPQLRPRSHASVPLGIESPVKKVLARILPLETSPTKPRKSPTKPRKRQDDRNIQECQAMSKAEQPQQDLVKMSPSKPRKHVTRPRQPASKEEKRKVVERFRRQLLDRFRSVHDAFKQLDGSGVRDKELSLAEFHVALARLDVAKADADVLFAALDADMSGRVSLNEFLHALTDVSEEALLWELRCRLNQNGICYSNLHKAFDLIRRFNGQAKNNRTRFGGCVLTGDERAKLRNMRETLQMGRAEWLKFGSSLGLTIFETERLFDIIDKDSSGSIDLQEMFVALCAAAPDVSLERFVTKVLIQYGTLQDAFKSHAHNGFIAVQEFLALCRTLDLNEENAMKIWEARECRKGPDSPTRDDPRGQPALREDEFVHQLQAWAPATALDRLKEQMCEQFGSVVEGKHALQRAGVGCKDVLSSQVFEASLRATGLQHCDSGLLLHTVAGHRDKHHASPQKGVTLDHVMGAISGGKLDGYEKARKAARLSVGNDMGPYWQQLHAMKNDLRSGLDKSDKLAKDGKFAFGEKGDRLLGVVRKAVDDLKQGQTQLCGHSHSVRPPSRQRRMHGKGPIRRGSKFSNPEGRNVSPSGLNSQTFG